MGGFTWGFLLGTVLATSAYNFDFYASMGNAFYRPHKMFYDKIQTANKNGTSLRGVDYIDYGKDFVGSLIFFGISLPPIVIQEFKMRQESAHMKQATEKALKIVDQIDPQREMSFEEFQRRVMSSINAEKK